MASPDEPVLGRPDAVPSTRLDTFPVETAGVPVTATLAQRVRGGTVVMVTTTGSPA
ncbi:uncharacterized protein METZ01_LOCUS510185 [marine metagenome]|uniref:Uncharacterized protein n=1 Tax=marine metagenome TaxID=408172 RepID=A0A383EKR2_9ZZZZ